MKNLSTPLIICLYAIILVVWFFAPDTDLGNITLSWMAALGAAGQSGMLGGMVNKAKEGGDKIESLTRERHAAHKQGAAGVVQMIQGVGMESIGRRKEKKAEALFPELIDPSRAQAHSNYQRMERGAATGSLFQNEVNTLMQGQRGREAAVARMAGTGGSALQAMALSSRVSGEQRNALMSGVMANRDKYTALADATSKEMSQRKLELKSWKYSQKMADAKKMKSAGRANMQAGLANTMNAA